MTCKPLIRADASSTLPHPTRVRLAVHPPGARLAAPAGGAPGKAVAGRTAGPTPAKDDSVGAAACLRMSATSGVMADMLDRLHSIRRPASTGPCADYDLPMSHSNDTLIAEAGQRLAAAAPGAKVILFGSRARGDTRPDSDLDLLVIEPEVTERRAESARLRRELRSLEVALDVVVISAEHAEEWADVPGTMVNEALREGRVLVEA
jgi:predicted nucleotidyltransferase